MKFHCFFEQSGTFKNEFKKLGYEAFDYDIQNEFGETDFVIDLFAEILNAYDNKPSIFDEISSEDTIIAFFPCTRFEAKIPLHFRGQAIQQKKWNIEKKLENCIQLERERADYYIYISKMVLVAIRRNIKMIIENPYTQPHYLTEYWCLKPSIIDKDRTLRGDYYKKPTQYWFINCEPKQNMILEAYTLNIKKTIMEVHDKVERSLIAPEYANRFIREFII